MTLLLAERPRPASVRDWRFGWWLAIGAVCLGAFMGQLDASIVVLTYPVLGSRFHASGAAVEWVSLGYLLTLIALLVPAGRLSDAHGRKLHYLYGFLVFTLASAACGLAPSLAALIGFRAVQAVGAALMQANSVALVATSAPRARLRAALGVQAGAQAVGLALGPTLGGIIVVGLGWRWVFLLNVPVGALGMVAGHYFLPRTRIRTPVRRFDWPGLLLLGVSSTALLLAISAASGLELSDATVVALFAVAALAGFGLARRLVRTAGPLIDPALLRTRGTVLGLLGALGGYLTLFGPLVLVPAELTRHGTALDAAGLVLTALPAGFALAALAADRVLPRAWTDRRRALTGSVVALCALAALLPEYSHAPFLVPPLALLGVGLGLFAPANNALIMAAIPPGAEGTGGGLVNMARALGTALGVALVTLGLHQATHSTVLAAALLAAVGVAVLAVTAAAHKP
ncbi:MAG TPA: MFS transporter, partial [Actinocrinis sp.]|uniref:MFS transporter n=1 Tax=Actinocrinis sp. TaxID=1920516 RepID=UPI002DDD76A6